MSKIKGTSCSEQSGWCVWIFY